MGTISDELRELIETGPLAHLVTTNPDGSAQVTAIWIGLDGDDVVSGHMHPRRKVRNLQRDPRFVLSFDAPRTPGELLQEHAVLRGTARVFEGDAYNLLDRLAKTYVGPDAAFPGDPHAVGYVVRYAVERVTGHGAWVTTD